MSKKPKREVLEGTVRSAKAQKSLTVTVPMIVKHPKYKKYLRRDRVFHVHDENNEAREGDQVAIRQFRPISKTKSWRLCRIVRPFART